MSSTPDKSRSKGLAHARTVVPKIWEMAVLFLSPTTATTQSDRYYFQFKISHVFGKSMKTRFWDLDLFSPKFTLFNSASNFFGEIIRQEINFSEKKIWVKKVVSLKRSILQS